MSTAFNLLTSGKLLAFSVAMSDEQNDAEDRAVGYGRDGCHFSGGSRMGNKKRPCEDSAFMCAVAPCAPIAIAFDIPREMTRMPVPGSHVQRSSIRSGKICALV